MVCLSVVVITFNEEANLARCLSSVAGLADEIIIVDSNSTDNTLAIGASFNARIIQNEFKGYGEQKNFATQQASHDWILSLDADEELTPELKNSILALKTDPQFNVYRMPRLTNYCGKWIRHCGWYPDRQTRLYNRTKGSWVEKKVHEFWQPTNKSDKFGLLTGDLRHYSFNSISEHIRKIEKYTELAAIEAASKGKKVSMLKVMLAPQWRFFSEFIIKLGFLDGYYGYLICRLSAYEALIKYSKIRQRNKDTNSK